MENEKEFAKESDKEFVYPKESTSEEMQTYDDSMGKIYDVYKLIAFAEALPEETVSVDALAERVFREKTWQDVNGHYVSPGEIYNVAKENGEKNHGVIDWEELQEKYPDLAFHLEKLGVINYETPILLSRENIIIDGIHRVLRAYIDGVKEIKAKRFDELPESALLSEDLRGKAHINNLDKKIGKEKYYD